MRKTLFDVLLPATGRRYDFWVPDDLTMQEASTLVSNAMQVAEPAFYRSTPNAALMYLPTGQIQDPHAKVAQIGFTDGDRFVLL